MVKIGENWRLAGNYQLSLVCQQRNWQKFIFVLSGTHTAYYNIVFVAL